MTNIPYSENLPFVKMNISELSNDIKKIQVEQEKVFIDLERGMNIKDAKALESLVHFQNAKNTPIQRWYPYREGYSKDLVDIFINDLGISHGIFDPFSGSGTTLLSSRLKGIDSIGIDTNPISIEVAKAENESYSHAELVLFNEIMNHLSNMQISDNIINLDFDLAEKVFNEEILRSLLQIREFIFTIDNEKVKRLVFVAWLSIIEEVSNVKKEGNGIKYKNRKRTSAGYIKIDKAEWEQIHFPQNKFEYVKGKLIDCMKIIKYDLANNYGSIQKRPEIILGNCLEMDKLISKDIQMTFFSPPYCNCFDYFEIHKVELWLGGFVKTKDDMKIFRNTGFRSNTNSILNKPITYKNEFVEKLIALIDTNNLWSNKIPDVIRGYFDDMNTLLAKLYERTEKNGFVSIVIGNSAYTGVIIPTDTILAEIGRENGFVVESILTARHLTTSSQQKVQLNGLKNYLRESIVILRK